MLPPRRPAPGFAEAPLRFATGAPPVAALADEARTARFLALVTRTDNPLPLARAALARFGSFANLLAATPDELFAMPGFGIHTVAGAKLLHEAALRLARAELETNPPLGNTPALLAYLNASISREKIEQFRILFLDAAGHLIADEAQARGTVNHTPVYPREVARRALDLGAASLVLVHNHPSGDPTPSMPDITMTEQVCAALALFGISVADHIIVGNGAYTSFRKEGLIQQENVLS